MKPLIVPNRKVRDSVVKRRIRGNIALKKGFVVSSQERETRRQQVESSPELKKLFPNSQSTKA